MNLTSETIRSRSSHLERYVARAPERLTRGELVTLGEATLKLLSSLEERTQKLLEHARLPALVAGAPKNAR